MTEVIKGQFDDVEEIIEGQFDDVEEIIEEIIEGQFDDLDEEVYEVVDEVVDEENKQKNIKKYEWLKEYKTLIRPSDPNYYDIMMM